LYACVRFAKFHGRRNQMNRVFVPNFAFQHAVFLAVLFFSVDSGPSKFPGAGSIRSTANDLLKFIAAYSGLTQSPLSSVMQKARELHRLECGQERLIWPGNDSVFEHGGLVSGFQTELAFDIKNRRGVVILSNCDNWSTIVPAIWKLILEGRSQKPDHIAPINVADYGRFIGRYETSNHITFIVCRRGDRLMIRCLGGPFERLHTPSFEVFPLSETKFRNDFWHNQIEFTANAKGQSEILFSSSAPGKPAYEPFRATQMSRDVPATPTPVIPDSKTYESYVGQYRKTFLFGLIRVGPTLSIAHMIDEAGDHLLGRAIGVPGRDEPAEFFPLTENHFVIEPSVADNVQLTFGRNKKGKATHADVYWNGRKIRGTRI